MALSRGVKIALSITAGAAVLGAGGAWWYRRRRKVGLPPVAGAVKDAIKSGRGKYLGSGKGWKDWDDKGTLPDEAAVADALELLGYGASGCIVNGKWVQATDCVAAIKLFQGDVNQVNAWRRAAEAGDTRLPEGGEPMIPPVLHKIGTGPTLGRDGKAGRSTIGALSDAIGAVEFATDKQCLDGSGRPVASNASACRAAWTTAVQFAREGNKMAEQAATA